MKNISCYIALTIVCILVMAGCGGGGDDVVITPPRASAVMANTYTPSVAVPVKLTVDNLTSSVVTAYAVEDAVPAGWTVAAISNSGVFDSVTNKVKWGPFVGNTPRTLSYSAKPPANATGTVKFNGTLAWDGANITIAGVREISH